ERVMLAPRGNTAAIAPGDVAILERGEERAVLGIPLLGRALDGCGEPLDGLPAPSGRRIAIHNVAFPARHRVALDRPLWTGIRALDGLLTFVRGMRIGIFGAPGTGKSTLLESIGRN